MHHTLIKANIALFQGDKAETRRLIREYREREAPGLDDPDTSMVLWLDAQSQVDRDERLRQLQALVAQTEPQDGYAQLAYTYLQEEEHYRRLLNPEKKRPYPARVWLMVMVTVCFGGILFAFGSGILRLPGQSRSQETAINDSPRTETGDPTATLPDKSQPLVSDSFMARYPAGILRVAAVEDDSERVIDLRTESPVAPVPGARFYVLSVIFECRSAICATPPESELAVRLDNGQYVAARSDVRIAGAPILEPVALGRTTAGWVIFEIPVISYVELLRVTAEDPLGTPVPLVIRLDGR